ncbi:MAG: MAPEG family protein [bacterium]
MSTSLLALVGYAVWMLALVLALIVQRSALTLLGKRAANGFKPTGDGGSAFEQRLVRAHANCYENLGLFAALIVAAQLSGHADVTDSLALVVLAARVAQSAIHLASTSVPAVSLRVTAVLVLVGIQGFWAVQLLRIALA